MKKINDNSRSLLSSILRLRCPACREGDFFIANNPYNLKKLGKYHSNCPKCNQRYSLEPGFYFGAAYVSYGLNVALFVAVVVALNIFTDHARLAVYVGAILLATLILAPIIYRLSRVIWASMFIPLGGEKKE